MLNINKNNLKSRKGITLVALVVTVVVLSILAGVSINLVISDDGLIVKSKETKEKQEAIQEKEHIKIAILDSQIRDASTSEIIKEKLEESLRQQLGNKVNFTLIENGSGNFTIKMNDTERTYYLESTGRIVDDENILEISTAEELKAFRDEVNNGNTFEGKVVCLTNNITLDINEKWIPIGLYLMTNTSADDVTNLPFKGTFDGRGYVIDNIYINTTDKSQALFGLVDNGKILNVGIGENCNITAGNATAGLVGCLNNKSVVSNCYNKSDINGKYAGGLIGTCKNSKVLNSYNIGNITASTHRTGGLLGVSTDSYIINCYNTGNVEGKYYIGGIVGQTSTSIVEKCYNKGTIIANSYAETGKSCVGGICGRTTGDEIKNVYNTGTITGEYPYVGGIIGANRGTLYNSYNIGNITGNDEKGGIVGGNSAYNTYKGVIKNSYSLNDDTLNIHGTNLAIISPECSVKSSDELKVMASTLGEAFKVDEENINQGYPILNWQ